MNLQNNHTITIFIRFEHCTSFAWNNLSWSNRLQDIKGILEKTGCEPKQFCGASMDNRPIVEDVLEKNISLYDIDIEAEDFIRNQWICT